MGFEFWVGEGKTVIEIAIAIGIGIERRSENTGDYLEIRKAGKLERGEGIGRGFEFWVGSRRCLPYSASAIVLVLENRR